MCVSKSSCLRSYVKTKCARFMLVRRGTGDPKHITIRASTMKGLLIGQASSTIHYWPKTTQSRGNIFSKEIFSNKSVTLNCSFFSGLICKIILKPIHFLKQWKASKLDDSLLTQNKTVLWEFSSVEKSGNRSLYFFFVSGLICEIYISDIKQTDRSFWS